VQHCRVFARALDAEPSSAPLRLYVHALCVEDAATDAYLGGLPSDGLRRVVDLQKQGLGRRTGGWVTRRFVVEELRRIGSEIGGDDSPGTTAGDRGTGQPQCPGWLPSRRVRWHGT
jgi:hypothetical protein